MKIREDKNLTYGKYVEGVQDRVLEFSELPLSPGLKKFFLDHRNPQEFFYTVLADFERWTLKKEIVQSPSVFFRTKKGDCKSFTTFFLAWGFFFGYNRGYGLLYRKKNGKKVYYHIFPVIGGVVMDVYTKEFSKMPENARYEIMTIQGIQTPDLDFFSMYGTPFVVAALMLAENGKSEAIAYLMDLGILTEEMTIALGSVSTMSPSEIFLAAKEFAARNQDPIILSILQDSVQIEGLWKSVKKIAKNPKVRKISKQIAKDQLKSAAEYFGADPGMVDSVFEAGKKGTKEAPPPGKAPSPVSLDPKAFSRSAFSSAAAPSVQDVISAGAGKIFGFDPKIVAIGGAAVLAAIFFLKERR